MADGEGGSGAISAGVVYMDVLPRMTKFVGAVNTGLAAAGARLSAVGRGLTRGLTLPILGAGAAAFKLSKDFERSMALIGGLVGTNEKQLASWKEQILNLSSSGKLTQTPRELADALYFVASSGFKGAAAFKALRASANAASAGLGDTMTVADAVTSAVSAFGPKVLTAADAADVLVATVREGKGEATELAGAIGRVIPVASNVGVSFNEVGAALASMTLTGLDSYEATTALRGIFQSFVKPAAQSRDALKEVGLSIQGIRKSIKEEGLLTTLLALRDRIGGNQDALGKILPNVRALNGFLSLTGERAGKNAKIFKDLENNVGDTSRAMEVMSRTSDFKLKTAMANLQSTAIRFGDIIAPGVQALVKQLNRAVTWFGNLDESTKKSIVKWAGYAAALGPVLFVSGKLLRIVGFLGKGLFNVGKGILYVGRMAGLSTGATLAWAGALGLAVVAGMKLNEYLNMPEEQGMKWAKGLEAGTKSLTKMREEAKRLREEEVGWFEAPWDLDSLAAAEALEHAMANYNKTFDKQVKSILEGTKHSTKYTRVLREMEGATIGQKAKLATLLAVTDRYGVTLNRSQQVTLDAFLATGDYRSALKLLQRALDGVLGPLKNSLSYTEKQGEAAGDAAQKNQRYAYWLKQVGINASNWEMPPVPGTPGYTPSGGGRGGQQPGASGSLYTRGGWQRVGEFGPENVWFPRGARIFSASTTRQMQGGGSGGGRLVGKLVLVGGEAYVEGVLDNDGKDRARFIRRRARMR